MVLALTPYPPRGCLTGSLCGFHLSISDVIGRLVKKLSVSLGGFLGLEMTIPLLVFLVKGSLSSYS